jgi:uncharacterized hydrophobic protein (TIGR00271 family)
VSYGLASFRERIERLLQIEPDSKPKVYLQVFQSAEFLNLNYILELLLSAGIATFGLVLNSPAVVIGAMLISPLMGPILAAGLAFATADLYLGLKALISIVLSSLTAILFSAALVWTLPFQSPTTEILARTQPNLLDLGVALLSGLAGSIVLCRGGGGGGITALPGVAIAVALMPPLCTVGFGVGSGTNWAIVSGAGLLYLTNLAAIIASAFLVFFIARMDASDVRMRVGYTALEAAAPDRLYQLLSKTRLARALGELGQLRWRALMLLVTLAILFVPLRNSLYQLRDETISRAAVRDVLRTLGPPDALLAQQLELTRDRIVVRAVMAQTIPQERIEQAERLIIQRTGKQASLQIRKVAGEEELAALRDRLRPPPPLPPPPKTMSEIGSEVRARLEAPLKRAWPEGAATLLGFEIGFAPDGVVVRIPYESPRPLEAGAQEMLQRVLKSALQINDLRVELEHRRPATRRRSAAAK